MTRPMNDRTPTEATWKLVPAEPTDKMAEAFSEACLRKLQDAYGTSPTEHPEEGGGSFGYGYRAMLAASPPAPAAEPVAFRKRLSAVDGHCTYATAEDYFTYSNVDMEGDWEPLYTHPLDAAAIRAEARREAFEEAAAWHDEKAEIARVDAERFRGGSNPYTQRMMIVARHKEAARAIRALADKGEADGWRPIETAPKDGTRVLLAVPGQGRAVIGMWDQAQPAFQKPAAWEFFLDEAREFGGSVSCAPTHWRPLPAPPAGGRDGE